MFEFLLIIFLTALVSFFAPISQLYTRKRFQFKLLFAYLFLGLLVHILMLSIYYLLGNANPITHVYNFSSFILLMFLFEKNGLNKKVTFCALLFGFLLFAFEVSSVKRWLDPSFIFYVYSLFVISLASASILFKIIKRTQGLNSFEFYFSTTFFIYSVSSMILGIYDVELRNKSEITAFILLLLNNLLTIFQNLGIAYSLWKLKEA
jgi:hypothetical protein